MAVAPIASGPEPVRLVASALNVQPDTLLAASLLYVALLSTPDRLSVNPAGEAVVNAFCPTLVTASV